MLMDGRTNGWTDDGQKGITIAHPEQSSGELKTNKLAYSAEQHFGELEKWLLYVDNCC